MRELIQSEHAAARLEAAASWLAARRREPVVIVAPRRRAADILARRVVGLHGSAFGWERLSFDALAGRLAARDLARRGLTAVSGTAIEAFCAHLLRRRIPSGSLAELGRLAPIADRPGVPGALASTFSELAHAGLPPEAVAAAAPDLAVLFAAYRDELPRRGLADRAIVLERAIAALGDDAEADRLPIVGLPLLLLDVPIRWKLEADLIAALAARSPAVRITVPRGDDRTRTLLSERIALRVVDPPVVDLAPAVAALQTHLFREVVQRVEDRSAVEIFSASGESREALEIARRILAEAERGTRFDRMAVFLRSPEVDGVHFVEAFRRAGIPAWFSPGLRRPDPAGRALLALLDCAAEGLSARAFAEYLSFDVVPKAAESTPLSARFPRDCSVPPDEELADLEDEPDREPFAPPREPEPTQDEDAPVRAESFRAPWRWEQLIAEVAVIGQRDRWARRIDTEIARTRATIAKFEDPHRDEAQVQARRLADLTSLRDFALPLIESLASLPQGGTWGVWIEALSAIAIRALRNPGRVLGVLRSLAPMSDVGPVDLAEVRAVLAPRLRDEIEAAPGEEESGRVLVCAIEEARGREFDVVFVPGLAAKRFPPKAAEDPFLPDHVRARISDALPTGRDRRAEERLLLEIAVGAARQRLVASFPRIDEERGRLQIPSSFALEVARAVEGELPCFEELTRPANGSEAARGNAHAPSEPSFAVDEAEYDLAVLRRLFALPREKRAGRAAYLIRKSEIAARALRARWRRHDSSWRPADGLVDPDEAVRAVLAEHTLDRRPHSATALQRFAACPYRFFLQAIMRLEPREVPKPREQLEPHERGTIFHAIQFRLLVRLRAEGALPVRPQTLPRALDMLTEVVREVAAHFKEELVPAYPQVWEDTIASIHSDLRQWLQRMSADPEWVPIRFELAFGLPGDTDCDAASRPDPVLLPGLALRLRGAIDLVEEREGWLRATDSKSGANFGRPVTPTARVFGGEKLQPLLYALALEALFPGRPVWGGRLYYCTAKGRFTEVQVPLDDDARAAIATVVSTVDEAVRTGFLPAFPAPKACTHCNYRPVCGPDEEARTARKDRKRVAKLLALREMP